MKIHINISTKIGTEYLVFKFLRDRLIIEHLLALAKKLNADKITLNLPQDKQDYAKSIISRYFRAEEFDFVEDKKEDADLALQDSNIYDIDKARRLYKKHKNIEEAVIWKIKEEADLYAAGEELIRSEWFPIGRYYIKPISKWLAQFLAKTKITANQVTTFSLFVGLLTAFLLLSKSRVLYIISGLLLIFFWMLDITDGQLARLKKSTTNFGSWFDNIVGEIIDYLVYLAIVYNLYTRNFDLSILWFGIFYFIGKHLFLYSMQAGKEKFYIRKAGESFVNLSKERKVIPALIKTFYFLHDNDVRMHFLALAIVFDLTILPLVVYAFYYNGWFIAKILIEYYRHRTGK